MMLVAFGVWRLYAPRSTGEGETSSTKAIGSLILRGPISLTKERIQTLTSRGCFVADRLLSHWQEGAGAGVEAATQKVRIFQKCLIFTPMNDTTVRPFMYEQSRNLLGIWSDAGDHPWSTVEMIWFGDLQSWVHTRSTACFHYQLPTSI